LYVLLGAAIAIGAFLVADDRGGSDAQRTAPSAPGSTTTTLAPAIAPKVFSAIRPSLVTIQATTPEGSALGSGVIFNQQGQILTANHVIDGATAIEVTFADGSSTAATVASSSPDRDTAVLTPASLPSVVVPAVFGGGIKVGDDAFAVGNPLGLADSMTAGVVSGLDRSIPREDGTGDLTGLIQFDAAVNPGNSGGPLLNRQGQVVGIVTALANPSGQRFFVGIGFAVPIGSGGGGGGRVPPS
jgi:S1-C subfamily serine protease